MSDDTLQSSSLINQYKLMDYKRKNQQSVTASSLQNLIQTARVRFEIAAHVNLTIVLEQDGTEIDDEDYFATLEKNTALMILQENQKWTPSKSKSSPSHLMVLNDTTDHGSKALKGEENYTEHCPDSIDSIVTSIQHDTSHLSLLSGTNLEMLSDMDPDSVADIISDKFFLEQLKEASNRFLVHKRQAQESMALLRMYSSNAEVEQT